MHLEPGASQKVTFELKPRDLSMVTEAGEPIVAEGEYTVSVGGGQPGTGAGADRALYGAGTDAAGIGSGALLERAHAKIAHAACLPVPGLQTGCTGGVLATGEVSWHPEFVRVWRPALHRRKTALRPEPASSESALMLVAAGLPLARRQSPASSGTRRWSSRSRSGSGCSRW